MLQSCLEAAYEIHSPWRAADFVVVWQRRGETERGKEPDEQVLLRQQTSGLEIALCFAPDLLRRLDAESRLEAADFTLALEAVSHFLCIAWNAGHGRQVSLVELELQAEIDKFLGLLYFQPSEDDSPQRLHHWLYAGGCIPGDLPGEARERYTTANRLAARYWLDLLRKYPSGLRDEALGRELRRFYRLSREAKLRRAAA